MIKIYWEAGRWTDGKLADEDPENLISRFQKLLVYRKPSEFKVGHPIIDEVNKKHSKTPFSVWGHGDDGYVNWGYSSPGFGFDSALGSLDDTLQALKEYADRLAPVDTVFGLRITQASKTEKAIDKYMQYHGLASDEARLGLEELTRMGWDARLEHEEALRDIQRGEKDEQCDKPHDKE